MTRPLAYLIVLAAAATPWLEVLLVVPAGLVAGLGVVPTVLLATVGNVATLVPVVLLGDRLRARLDRRGRGRGRAQRVLARYGLPGLAVLGPFLTGAHVAALAAAGSGAGRRRTLLWMSGGVLACAVAAAAATRLGIEVLVDPDSLPDIGLE